MNSTRVWFAIAVAWVTLERPGRAVEPIDYILPEARESRPEPQVIPGAEAAPGADDVVAYRSFDGHDYTLNRIKGLHVEVLAPDNWFGADALTPALARRLTDKLDILYAEYKEILGAEPQGPDKTTVAFVTNCGVGCGYVAFKGVEIDPGAAVRPYILEPLWNDQLFEVFHHEFAHNFDLYGYYLQYSGVDFIHAWTEYFDSFAGSIYNQAGTVHSTAAEARHRERTMLYDPYIKDPRQDWASCFRDAPSPLCPYPNGAWPATLIRFAAVHGDRAVLSYFAFLKQFRAAHSAPAPTVEERTDLHLRAMAEAVRQNTACYADAWRWYVSSELRAELTERFGAIAPACLDGDGDGARPILDDCDDSKATVSGKAKEVVGNQTDDDCDGRVDEREVKERGDFEAFAAVVPPVQINGKIATTADRDHFEASFPKATWVLANLCSTSNLLAYLEIDKGGSKTYRLVSERRCDNSGLGIQVEMPAGKSRFTVFAYSASGNYTLELQPGTPWPPAGWTKPKAATGQGSQVVLTAATAPGARFASPPTHVRFWVSGFGVVTVKPYKATTTFRWTPPAAIPAGTTYRAQALTNGVPSTAYSAAATVPPSSL